MNIKNYKIEFSTRENQRKYSYHLTDALQILSSAIQCEIEISHTRQKSGRKVVKMSVIAV